MNTALKNKELIKKLQGYDPESFVMFRDSLDLRYVYSISEEEAVELSEDEVDILSDYLDVQDMESNYEDEVLDFFSIVVLS